MRLNKQKNHKSASRLSKAIYQLQFSGLKQVFLLTQQKITTDESLLKMFSFQACFSFIALLS